VKRASATLCALLLGVAVTTALPAASAAPPAGAQAGAQASGPARRFAAAQKLFDDGAYAPAYEEFKALAAETGSPNAALYTGLCLRELGRLPEAYEVLTRALRDATARAAQEPQYAQTRNTAAADLALLEPRIGKLVVAVADPPPGLSVTLDGVALSPDRLGVPVAAAVGEVVVRMTAPGRVDVERRLTLRGGETSTLTVALAPLPIVAEPAPPMAPPPAPGVPLGGARLGGFVMLGVGAAGMATFATAGVLSNQRYSAVYAACGGTHCTDPSYAAQIDGGRHLDLAADVGLGVGLAGLVGGALLVVFGGPRANEGGAPVTAWVAPGGGGVVAAGAF
jgi:hypothetical protein